jgi:hypothetical protein
LERNKYGAAIIMRYLPDTIILGILEIILMQGIVSANPIVVSEPVMNIETMAVLGILVAVVAIFAYFALRMIRKKNAAR